MSSVSTSSAESYYLFGFPIAHSASPALHNYIFSHLGLPRTYRLRQTTRIGTRVQELCRADDFGGASVTMPLKVSVARMLDHMTEAARHIGAVNTIVPVQDGRGRVKLVGTNTDWLGVKNALLHAWPASPATPFPLGPSLVIGGGGAARAAVYALASLHCTPVYLVGRDAGELKALVRQFPDISCIPVTNTAQARGVVLVVSCVPAVPPATPEEYAADACARAILGAYPRQGAPAVFLDMCYKPRMTPLMLHAQGFGWRTVSGIEAMLEQGLAQARMWLIKSVEPSAGADIIPSEVEDGARALIRRMPDIVVRPGTEMALDDDEDIKQTRRTVRQRYPFRL